MFKLISLIVILFVIIVFPVSAQSNQECTFSQNLHNIQQIQNFVETVNFQNDLVGVTLANYIENTDDGTATMAMLLDEIQNRVDRLADCKMSITLGFILSLYGDERELTWAYSQIEGMEDMAQIHFETSQQVFEVLVNFSEFGS